MSVLEKTSKLNGSQILLELASTQPIAFSQVREDALLDLELVQSLGRDLNGVMIASGGCTASLLAATNLFEKIDLVDSNKTQLTLTKLKLWLLANTSTKTRLQILGHIEIAPELRYKQIEEILNQLDIDEGIAAFGNPDLVSNLGLDHCGRYELVFAALRAKLEEYDFWAEQIIGCSLPNNSRKEELEKALKTSLQSVMSQSNLCHIFGDRATANRRLDFHEHFYKQTTDALCWHHPSHNPYLTQMLTGSFQQGHIYPWMTARSQALPALSYMESDITNFILQAEKNSYDFVHLSNTLDWLNEDEASKLLNNTERVMKPGGLLIIRQLNSNLDVKSLSSNIEWLGELSNRLLEKDRSFFYREIYVGRKRK